MTVARMVGVLAVLTLIGLGIVWMRVEQARHLKRIEELKLEATELRRELWAQDTEIAALRSPPQIRKRLEELGLLADRTDPGANRPPR